jgi:protein-disulfide isomerase
MKTTRRTLLSTAVALAVLPATQAFAEDAPPPVDLKALNTPPAIGEMELGPKDAKVTMIEYASASCPHCRDFYREVYVQLKKDYIDTGKIHFIFREFPHNDPAMAAFMLARCSPKEKYFPMIDVFFSTQEKWMADPLNGLKEIAKQTGMTEDVFNACLKNQKMAKDIYAVRQQGEKFGVTGIPTIFINGERFDGDRTIEAVKAKIDPLLG